MDGEPGLPGSGLDDPPFLGGEAEPDGEVLVSGSALVLPGDVGGEVDGVPHDGTTA